MTAAIAMNVPASRVLAGWWRDLAAHRPRRLWFAHLVLHHIEALVEIGPSEAEENLARALLGVLRRQSRPVTLAELQSLLRLDAAVAERLVHSLCRRQAVTRDAEGRLSPTPEGAVGPAAGQALRQRRVFHFTDEPSALFVPIAESACIALMPPPQWSFDLAALERTLGLAPPWRQDNQFPAEVRAVVRPAGEDRATAITVDRAEQALLTLVQAGEQVLGFSVSPESWELRREPSVTLTSGAELAGSLLQPPALEEWGQAWQLWCQQRSLPTSEVEACRLEPGEHRLVVRAPARLVDRLRQARNEVIRGEAWLLAGAGRVRSAARLELTT